MVLPPAALPRRHLRVANIQQQKKKTMKKKVLPPAGKQIHDPPPPIVPPYLHLRNASPRCTWTHVVRDGTHAQREGQRYRAVQEPPERADVSGRDDTYADATRRKRAKGLGWRGATKIVMKQAHTHIHTGEYCNYTEASLNMSPSMLNNAQKKNETSTYLDKKKAKKQTKMHTHSLHRRTSLSKRRFFLFCFSGRISYNRSSQNKTP